MLVQYFKFTFLSLKQFLKLKEVKVWVLYEVEANIKVGISVNLHLFFMMVQFQAR